MRTLYTEFITKSDCPVGNPNFFFSTLLLCHSLLIACWSFPPFTPFPFFSSFLFHTVWSMQTSAVPALSSHTVPSWGKWAQSSCWLSPYLGSRCLLWRNTSSSASFMWVTSLNYCLLLHPMSQNYCLNIVFWGVAVYPFSAEILAAPWSFTLSEDTTVWPYPGSSTDQTYTRANVSLDLCTTLMYLPWLVSEQSLESEVL